MFVVNNTPGLPLFIIYIWGPLKTGFLEGLCLVKSRMENVSKTPRPKGVVTREVDVLTAVETHCTGLRSGFIHAVFQRLSLSRSICSSHTML